MSGCPVTGETVCHCTSKTIATLAPRPKDTMRKLFTDHAIFTARFINAYLNQDEETPALQDRLLANQTEIGNYLGKFLGVDAGILIGELLTEHIKRAANVVMTLARGDDTTATYKALIVNAREVAEALATVSAGQLNQQDVEQQFITHNNMVVELAKLHNSGNYKLELDLYDQYYTHMLAFSDLLTCGLIH